MCDQSLETIDAEEGLQYVTYVPEASFEACCMFARFDPLPPFVQSPATSLCTQGGGGTSIQEHVTINLVSALE